MVAKFTRTLNINEARGKCVIAYILIEEHIYVEVTMTGIDGITT